MVVRVDSLKQTDNFQNLMRVIFLFFLEQL